ncbi:Uncharacterised protein [Enterobacter kobei]|nr:Uncharacterised protein [Enterobacter kobei]
MSRLLVRFTFFFHFPECVAFMNLRHDGKVIERRWRRGRPLQRTATPWVTGQVTVLIAVANRHVELNQLRRDTAGNQHRTARCNHQHWVELRIDLLAQTTGHTHEAQHVQRHKCHEEADDPEPERAFTPFLVQREAERFWPPVGYAREAAEDHATDDNVMEVRNQEQTVVQNEVSTWYRQQYTGHPTYGEGHDEADGPQHR